MNRDLEAENLELATRAWRNQVEKLVCVIEELIPLCKASRRWIELSSVESVIRAENVVDEYRKQYPRTQGPGVLSQA